MASLKKSYQVTITPEDYAFLCKEGMGNLSDGIGRVVLLLQTIVALQQKSSPLKSSNNLQPDPAPTPETKSHIESELALFKELDDL